MRQAVDIDVEVAAGACQVTLKRRVIAVHGVPTRPDVFHLFNQRQQLFVRAGARHLAAGARQVSGAQFARPCHQVFRRPAGLVGRPQAHRVVIDALLLPGPGAGFQKFDDANLRRVVTRMLLLSRVEAGFVHGDSLPYFALLRIVAACAARLEAEPAIVAHGRVVAHAVGLVIDFFAALAGAVGVVVRAVSGQCAKARAGQRRRAVHVAAHRHATPAHLRGDVEVRLRPRGAGAGAGIGHFIGQLRHGLAQPGHITLIQNGRDDPAQGRDALDLVGPFAGFVGHLVHVACPVRVFLHGAELHVRREGQFAEPAVR